MAGRSGAGIAHPARSAFLAQFVRSHHAREIHDLSLVSWPQIALRSGLRGGLARKASEGHAPGGGPMVAN